MLGILPGVADAYQSIATASVPLVVRLQGSR
jgi:succinyl-CoA synthetase beta subunit